MSADYQRDERQEVKNIPQKGCFGTYLKEKRNWFCNNKDELLAQVVQKVGAFNF